MSEPQLGTYRYYAREWAEYHKLAKDPATPLDDLRRAHEALGFLYFQTFEPRTEPDRSNFRMSLQIATRYLTDREVYEGLDHGCTANS